LSIVVSRDAGKVTNGKERFLIHSKGKAQKKADLFGPALGIY
jgi:hypothetical protein